MAFHDDVKSKHLSNFVLVTIGDDIRISTQKITFDEDYYKPILLNIPSISESLDIEQRKYKISSVSLSISDYEVDGERFSDSLNTLMNKEVNIYYASQSCLNLDDCYKAGNYIVRTFSQDEDKVTLNCEDLSQDKLQTEIPLQDMGDNESILEKYRNKPIPMVFGEVDRSPCVLDSKKIIFDVDNATDLSGITIDNIFIKTKTPLYVYDDDSTYSNVLHEISEILTEEEFPYIEEQQYTDVSNLGYLELKNTKLLRKDGIQVRRFAKSASPNLYNDNQVENIVDATDIIDRDGNPQDTIDNDTSSYVLVQDAQFHTSDEAGGIDGDFNPITQSIFRYYRMIIPIVKAKDTIANSIPEIAINNKRFPIPFNGLSDEGSNFINNADNENYIIAGGSNAGSLNNVPYFPNNLESHPSSLQDYSDLIIFNEVAVGTELGQGEASLDQFNVDIGFKDTSFQESSAAIGCFANEQLFELVFFAKLPQVALLPSGETYTSELVARIREIDTTFIADIKEPLKKNYFVHAIGRAGEAPSSQAIYTEILSELDFDQQLEPLGDIELGKYAFTIDKKINSKKLIEELSQSTPLYPYFKDGEFRVKSIKTNYDGTNNIIKAEDVINYKYDRTKIEKVYTRVNVKYHYDYGLKDFTKETGDVFPNESGLNGYDPNLHFGQGFDQEFVFESKYIRDKDTARNLAKYLCGLHANQHNLITLTLPLNYLTLELGDIVKFDKLIQDRKIFGEDYTNLNYGRNGQNIYGLFFVEKIKKSLDKVEVSLYQLHEFGFEFDIEQEVIYGCTDINAINYDPNATHDSGCEYLVVEGCTNPQAVNYNPDAETDSGTCVLQTDMLPPTITSPVDGFQITNEIEEQVIEGDLIVSDNLISNPENNSFFDNNVGATNESELLQCVLNTTDYIYDLYTGNLITNNGYQISVLYSTEQLLDVGTLINIWNESEELILGNVPILSLGYGYLWIEWNDALSGYSYVQGYISISSQDTTELVQNSDWEVAHNFGMDNPILSAGNGTLKIGYTEVSNQSAYVDLVDTINRFTEINVSIDIKKNVYSNTSYHRILIGFPILDTFVLSDDKGSLVYINDETQDYYLTEEWQTIQFSFTPSYDTNRLAIMGRSVNNLTEIEIDNVIITTLVGNEEQIITNEIAPTLNINWDESPSIGQLISALDLTTSGYYKVFISQFIDGIEPTQINAIVYRNVNLHGFSAATNISEIYPVEDLVGGTLNYTELNFSVNILGAYYHRGLLVLNVPEIDSVINAPPNSPVIITFNDGVESSELIEYESEQLTSLNHNVNLGDTYFPVNTDLKLTVTAYSNSQYNETNIFNSTNGIPQASDSINFEWVDEDIQDDVVEE